MVKKSKQLRSSSNQDISSFITQAKKAPLPVQAGKNDGRLVFAMDATASREPTWRLAQQIQQDMFGVVSDLGTLDIQLCCFRGEAEFIAFPWGRDAITLRGYMQEVICRMGLTQINRVLRHTVRQCREQKINALVYVGDCVEESPENLIQQAGQLALNGVPAFMFQEGHDPLARMTFKKISEVTHGAYSAFDAGSAQQLRELLTAVAVYATGGKKALLEYAGEDTKRLEPVIKQLTKR